ncbi:MAG: tRNA lysidine(34) synthetase TilS [Clostridia bacterium]|nr:tRNA lysidine(34) synthetase TilS [Clostridia bacterium]
MICKVKETINRYAMLENTSSVAIGLSGGADSVCLFDVLLKLRTEFGFEIAAVHVNHNLRGEEALRDQKFVEELCKKNGVKLNVVSEDVSALAKKMHIGIEECGRKVRYEAFESTGCDKIAVAHSLSDCIETTVFNLIRGSSLSGITRIPPIRGKIIRPLINCTSEEIRRYCNENNLDFVVDSTNLHDDYSRNFIRERIIPQFSRLNGNFAESFERFYDSVEKDENFLNLQAEQLFEKAVVNSGFSREILLSSDEAVLKRWLRFILNKNMKKQVEKSILILLKAQLKNALRFSFQKTCIFPQTVI